MNINTDTMVPISVANQNFSKVARLVDQFGSAVILKNNAPRYIIYEFNRRMPCRPQQTTMYWLPR